jgi:hypothetical protein
MRDGESTAREIIESRFHPSGLRIVFATRSGHLPGLERPSVLDEHDRLKRITMKKLIAAVAISAFALISVAPAVQATETTTTQIHKPAKPHVHKVVQKKKAKGTKSTKKKVTKTSQVDGARLV